MLDERLLDLLYIGNAQHTTNTKEPDQPSHEPPQSDESFFDRQVTIEEENAQWWQDAQSGAAAMAGDVSIPVAVVAEVTNDLADEGYLSSGQMQKIPPHMWQWMFLCTALMAALALLAFLSAYQRMKKLSWGRPYLRFRKKRQIGQVRPMSRETLQTGHLGNTRPLSRHQSADCALTILRHQLHAAQESMNQRRGSNGHDRGEKLSLLSNSSPTGHPMRELKGKAGAKGTISQVYGKGGTLSANSPHKIRSMGNGLESAGSGLQATSLVYQSNIGAGILEGSIASASLSKQFASPIQRHPVGSNSQSIKQLSSTTDTKYWSFWQSPSLGLDIGRFIGLGIGSGGDSSRVVEIDHKGVEKVEDTAEVGKTKGMTPLSIRGWGNTKWRPLAKRGPLTDVQDLPRSDSKTLDEGTVSLEIATSDLLQGDFSKIRITYSKEPSKSVKKPKTQKNEESVVTESVSPGSSSKCSARDEITCEDEKVKDTPLSQATPVKLKHDPERSETLNYTKVLCGDDKEAAGPFQALHGCHSYLNQTNTNVKFKGLAESIEKGVSLAYSMKTQDIHGVQSVTKLSAGHNRISGSRIPSATNRRAWRLKKAYSINKTGNYINTLDLYNARWTGCEGGRDQNNKVQVQHSFKSSYSMPSLPKHTKSLGAKCDSDMLPNMILSKKDVNRSGLKITYNELESSNLQLLTENASMDFNYGGPQAGISYSTESCGVRKRGGLNSQNEIKSVCGNLNGVLLSSIKDDLESVNVEIRKRHNEDCSISLVDVGKESAVNGFGKPSQMKTFNMIDTWSRKCQHTVARNNFRPSFHHSHHFGVNNEESNNVDTSDQPRLTSVDRPQEDKACCRIGVAPAKDTTMEISSKQGRCFPVVPLINHGVVSNKIHPPSARHICQLEAISEDSREMETISSAMETRTKNSKSKSNIKQKAKGDGGPQWKRSLIGATVSPELSPISIFANHSSRGSAHSSSRNASAKLRLTKGPKLKNLLKTKKIKNSASSSVSSSPSSRTKLKLRKLTGREIFHNFMKTKTITRNSPKVDDGRLSSQSFLSPTTQFSSHGKTIKSRDCKRNPRPHQKRSLKTISSSRCISTVAVCGKKINNSNKCNDIRDISSTFGCNIRMVESLSPPDESLLGRQKDECLDLSIKEQCWRKKGAAKSDVNVVEVESVIEHQPKGAAKTDINIVEGDSVIEHQSKGAAITEKKRIADSDVCSTSPSSRSKLSGVKTPVITSRTGMPPRETAGDVKTEVTKRVTRNSQVIGNVKGQLKVSANDVKSMQGTKSGTKSFINMNFPRTTPVRKRATGYPAQPATEDCSGEPNSEQPGALAEQDGKIKVKTSRSKIQETPKADIFQCLNTEESYKTNRFVEPTQLDGSAALSVDCTSKHGLKTVKDFRNSFGVHPSTVKNEWALKVERGQLQSREKCDTTLRRRDIEPSQKKPISTHTSNLKTKQSKPTSPAKPTVVQGEKQEPTTLKAEVEITYLKGNLGMSNTRPSLCSPSTCRLHGKEARYCLGKNKRLYQTITHQQYTMEELRRSGYKFFTDDPTAALRGNVYSAGGANMASKFKNSSKLAFQRDSQLLRRPKKRESMLQVSERVLNGTNQTQSEFESNFIPQSKTEGKDKKAGDTNKEHRGTEQTLKQQGSILNHSRVTKAPYTAKNADQKKTGTFEPVEHKSSDVKDLQECQTGMATDITKPHVMNKSELMVKIKESMQEDKLSKTLETNLDAANCQKFNRWGGWFTAPSETMGIKPEIMNRNIKRVSRGSVHKAETQNDRTTKPQQNLTWKDRRITSKDEGKPNVSKNSQPISPSRSPPKVFHFGKLFENPDDAGNVFKSPEITGDICVENKPNEVTCSYPSSAENGNQQIGVASNSACLETNVDALPNDHAVLERPPTDIDKISNKSKCEGSQQMVSSKKVDAGLPETCPERDVSRCRVLPPQLRTQTRSREWIIKQERVLRNKGDFKTLELDNAHRSKEGVPLLSQGIRASFKDKRNEVLVSKVDSGSRIKRSTLQNSYTHNRKKWSSNYEVSIPYQRGEAQLATNLSEAAKLKNFKEIRENKGGATREIKKKKGDTRSVCDRVESSRPLISKNAFSFNKSTRQTDRENRSVQIKSEMDVSCVEVDCPEVNSYRKTKIEWRIGTDKNKQHPDLSKMSRSKAKLPCEISTGGGHVSGKRIESASTPNIDIKVTAPLSMTKDKYLMDMDENSTNFDIPIKAMSPCLRHKCLHGETSQIETDVRPSFMDITEITSEVAERFQLPDSLPGLIGGGGIDSSEKSTSQAKIVELSKQVLKDNSEATQMKHQSSRSVEQKMRAFSVQNLSGCLDDSKLANRKATDNTIQGNSVATLPRCPNGSPEQSSNTSLGCLATPIANSSKSGLSDLAVRVAEKNFVNDLSTKERVSLSSGGKYKSLLRCIDITNTKVDKRLNNYTVVRQDERQSSNKTCDIQENRGCDAVTVCNTDREKIQVGDTEKGVRFRKGMISQSMREALGEGVGIVRETKTSVQGESRSGDGAANISESASQSQLRSLSHQESKADDSSKCNTLEKLVRRRLVTGHLHHKFQSTSMLNERPVPVIRIVANTGAATETADEPVVTKGLQTLPSTTQSQMTDTKARTDHSTIKRSAAPHDRKTEQDSKTSVEANLSTTAWGVSRMTTGSKISSQDPGYVSSAAHHSYKKPSRSQLQHPVPSKWNKNVCQA